MTKLGKCVLGAILTLTLAIGAVASFTAVAMADPGECIFIVYNPQTQEFTGTYYKDGVFTERTIDQDDMLLKGMSPADDGKTLVLDGFVFTTQLRDTQQARYGDAICPITITDDITIKLMGDSFITVELEEPLDLSNLTAIGLLCQGNLTLAADSEGTLNINIPCPVTDKEFNASIGIEAEGLVFAGGEVTVNANDLLSYLMTNEILAYSNERGFVAFEGEITLTGSILPSRMIDPIELGELYSGKLVFGEDEFEIDAEIGDGFEELFDQIFILGENGEITIRDEVKDYFEDGFEEMFNYFK